MTPVPGRRGVAVAGLVLLAVACGNSSSTATSPASSRPGGTSSAGTVTAPATTPLASASWLTYHSDGFRSGADTTSPSPASPSPAWSSPALDGAIYAEPLVDGDLVLIATEGGTLYGLDAATGTVRWQRHVADPVPRSALPCGDVFPLGITGTPVIDAATHVAYAVAETGDGQHLLAAVDDRSGSPLWQQTIDPPGTEPINQQQRSALALTSGRVVVAMGGLFGDCGQYRGYVVSLDAGGGGQLRSWIVPASREAGLWAPSGPAVAANGDLFVVTGNGAPTSTFDHSDSVVRLNPDMQESDYFAPTNWQALSGGDTDLGSTGVTLLDSGLALAAGKDGIAYVLRTDHLGGIGGAVTSLDTGGAVFGGLAVSGGVAYFPADNGLVAVRVSPSGRLTKVWRGPAVWPPIVAGGAVWAVERDRPVLDALDPVNGTVVFQYALTAAEHFTSPTAAHGRLYVAASDHVVALTGI